MREIFEMIYEGNWWGSEESRSGPGSTLTATVQLRAQLPRLLEEIRATSLLDAPCGDFNWMQSVVATLPNLYYIGGDIVPGIIETNLAKTAHICPVPHFLVCDITTSQLLSADVIMVRDVMVHLSLADIYRALSNIRRHNFPYILLTHFSGGIPFVDRPTGMWRPINFCLPPFNFPQPRRTIVEGNVGHPDKELALWAGDDIASIQIP